MTMTAVDINFESKTSSPTQRTRKALLTRTSRTRATEQALEERRKQYQKNDARNGDDRRKYDEKVLTTRKMLLNLQVTSMRHLLDDGSVGERSQKSESSTRSSQSDRKSNSKKSSSSKSISSKGSDKHGTKKSSVSKAEAILKANQQFTSIVDSSIGISSHPFQTPQIDFRKIFESTHANHKAKGGSKQPAETSFRDLASRVCAGRNMSFRDLASRKSPSKTKKTTAFPMESFAEEQDGDDTDDNHEDNDFDEFEFDDLFGNEYFDEVEWGSSTLTRDRSTPKRGEATDDANYFPCTPHFGESFSSILDPFTEKKNYKYHDDSNTVTTASSDSSSLLKSPLSQSTPPRKPTRKLDDADADPQDNTFKSIFETNTNFFQDFSQPISTTKLEQPKASRRPRRSSLVMFPTLQSSNDGSSKGHDDRSVIRSRRRSSMGSTTVTTTSSSSHCDDRSVHSRRSIVDFGHPDTGNRLLDCQKHGNVNDNEDESLYGRSRVTKTHEKKLKDDCSKKQGRRSSMGTSRKDECAITKLIKK